MAGEVKTFEFWLPYRKFASIGLPYESKLCNGLMISRHVFVDFVSSLLTRELACFADAPAAMSAAKTTHCGSSSLLTAFPELFGCVGGSV